MSGISYCKLRTILISPPQDGSSDNLTDRFPDISLSLGTPNNATCNYDVGSTNFYRGEVSYANYGYNVKWSSAGVFLGMFAASAGKLDSVKSWVEGGRS